MHMSMLKLNICLFDFAKCCDNCLSLVYKKMLDKGAVQ